MPFKTLTIDQVETFLAQDGVVVLDHRDASSYTKGHLPGAMQVHDQLIMQLIRKNKETPVLVYCYRGNSSKDLCTLLVNFGLKNVYNLEGGWQSWGELKVKTTTVISDQLKKWLVDYNFDPLNLNSRIDNGMSPVMQAAMLAEESYLEELLAAGADVNLVNDDKNNAMWFACVSEDINIISILVAKNINLNNSNVNGATSLIYAASAGKFSVVKALVEAGADIYAATLDGFNALDSASTIEILKFLKPQYKAA